MINLIMFVVIGIIATIAGVWTETIFFLVGMLPIRAIAGGYHAMTPQRCNILTFSVYSVNILAINLVKAYMTNVVLIVFIGGILFSIFKYAPVDHKKKLLGEQAYITARRYSRIIGIILLGFCLGVAIVFGPRNIIVISTIMGALTASISLIIGSVKRGGEKNEKTEFTT